MVRVILLLVLAVLMGKAAASDVTSSDNKLKASGYDVHGLILDETAAAFRAGTTGAHVRLTTRPAGAVADFAGAMTQQDGAVSAVFTSRVIETPFPFNDCVPSWNVSVREETGFRVEMRFGSKGTSRWTVWYYLGTWGACPVPSRKITSNADGRVEIDYFGSQKLFDRIQYRVRLCGRPDRPGPHLRRFAMAVSNTRGDEALYRRVHREPSLPPKTRWARRLPVPYRSQEIEDESIRGSVCSPTCVAMVMEYRGVARPTRRMCDIIWDPEYRIYGNWARAVQGAFVEGVPGYVRRFGSLDEVKALTADGQPVIASIRVPKGALTGAPYAASAGHLIVITGFDANGDVHVNDPAARPPASGQLTYKADEIRTVWLDKGGVGYVLLPPEQPRPMGGPVDSSPGS